MLAMGASRPWPDALEAITGQRQMDATRDGRLLRAAQDVARRAELSDGASIVTDTKVERYCFLPHDPARVPPPGATAPAQQAYLKRSATAVEHPVRYTVPSVL